MIEIVVPKIFCLKDPKTDSCTDFVPLFACGPTLCCASQVILNCHTESDLEVFVPVQLMK